MIKLEFNVMHGGHELIKDSLMIGVWLVCRPMWNLNKFLGVGMHLPFILKRKKL